MLADVYGTFYRHRTDIKKRKKITNRLKRFFLFSKNVYLMNEPVFSFIFKCNKKIYIWTFYYLYIYF